MKFHDRVTVSIEDHVAHVLLDRADKMNALDEAMFEGIIAAGHHLHHERGVRCVVLSGAGRAFCAGLDLASMSAADRWGEGGLPERTHGNCNRPQQAAMVWRKLPMPVIAAVHGVCFGGGLQIMSGACMRIIAPDARLSIMEMRWGLIPDMGGYALWRGTVRDDVLRELTYTNREFSGEEAGRVGFATHLDADPYARAMAIATDIATKNPDAVRAAKDLFNRTPDLDTDAILMEESVLQDKIIRTPNQMEAVFAFMQKRAANFS